MGCSTSCIVRVCNFSCRKCSVQSDPIILSPLKDPPVCDEKPELPQVSPSKTFSSSLGQASELQLQHHLLSVKSSLGPQNSRSDMIYEGLLLKSKGRTSAHYVSRWCQLTMDAFVIYEDQEAACMAYKRPIAFVPVTAISEVAM